MKKVINGICVVLAFVCVGLGAIGIVVPILPTTPLFLAAAVLFAKGSKRFHQMVSFDKALPESSGGFSNNQIHDEEE